MARYRIEEKASTVSIELTDVAGDGAGLMQAFGECQSGQCSCPTNEYDKLESMHMQQSGDAIKIQLEPKQGETLDTSEIAACLDYTTSKVTKTNKG